MRVLFDVEIRQLLPWGEDRVRRQPGPARDDVVTHVVGGDALATFHIVRLPSSPRSHARPKMARSGPPEPDHVAQAGPPYTPGSAA